MFTKIKTLLTQSEKDKELTSENKLQLATAVLLLEIAKADFIAVNGYNEDFEGWGREDSELGRRFHNYGLLNRRLKNIAIIYHIYHYEKPKDKS